MYAALVMVAQVLLGANAANISATFSGEKNDAEDLSPFSKSRQACPQFIPWPDVPAPISCDDPSCRGMSWAKPPYRCRQPDGVMSDKSIFGCPCCPRKITCDDASCEGDSQTEICKSELLLGCVCIASRRMVPVPRIEESAGDTRELVADRVADLSIDEDRDSNSGIPLLNPQTCPSSPPIRCLNPQCRGLDDWKVEISRLVAPRCNQADGELFIEGTAVALHGCQCCPEYISCHARECDGDARQTCTSPHLRGCFCDWPGRGPHITPWQPRPHVFVNDIDHLFDDPEAEYYNDGHGLHIVDPHAAQAPYYDPPGGEFGYTVINPGRTTSSSLPNTTPAPLHPSNLTWMETRSIQQFLFTLLPKPDISL